MKRLKKKELMYLNENSLMVSYSKADNLFNSYDENRHVYFIKKGALKLTRVTDEGKELFTYLIPRGTIFGITQLLTEEYTGNEIMTAVQDSIICKIPMDLFKKLMHENDDLNNHVLKLSGLRIKRLENRLENILFKTAEDRIKDFLTSFPKEYGELKEGYYESNFTLTHKEIAALTNSSRQKVNQVMNQMKRSEVIDFNSKSIKLLNAKISNE